MFNNTKKFINLKKINKITVILVILGIGMGLFITAQWRTKTLRANDNVIPYVSLVNTRDKLTEEQTKLKKQISELQTNIKDDQEKLKKQSQSKEAVEQVEQYKDKLGLTEKRGNGVVITLDDSRSTPANSDSITHAADLRDIVNLLWGAGAEAISINGERVVVNTSIDCIVNTVLINNTKTTAPFTISVVGDQKKISDALTDENNLKDIHKRTTGEGLVFEVSQVSNIVISPFDGSFPIKYAKIKE
jgi:uncharacterized protein YlxW (UPF0749 family)